MAGAQEWQNQIYQRYRDKVAQYIAGKIVNRQDVEDLVQNVFLKCYQKQATYDGQMASISTWIYTITRNIVIDYFRQHRQHEELKEDYVSTEEDGCERIFREETLAELAEALKSLDQRKRDIVILHYYAGLSLKEIAGRMGMSYANLRLLHKKAMLQLRELLGDLRAEA